MINWKNIFRLLLLIVFVISTWVTFNAVDNYSDKSAAIGVGIIAAASLICFTMVELHIWNEKKR